MNIIENIIKVFKQFKIDLNKKEAKQFYEMHRDLFKGEFKLDCGQTEFLKTTAFSARTIEEARKEYLIQVNCFFDFLEKQYADGLKKISLEKHSYVNNEAFRLEGLLPVDEETKVFYVIRELFIKEPEIRYENEVIFVKIGKYEISFNMSSYENKSNLGNILRKAKKLKRTADVFDYLGSI